MELELVFEEESSRVLYTPDHGINNPGMEYMMSQCPENRGQVKIYGKVMDVPRFQKPYFHNYAFTGLDHAAEQYDDENHWHRYLMQLVERCNQIWRNNQDTLGSYDENQSLNGVLVNWYHDGNSYIGHHSDSEKSLVPLSPIFSFSFGAKRDFHIRPRKNPTNGCSKANLKVDLPLEDGSLTIMAGTLQRTHTHALPKRKRCNEPRVNITIRAFN